MRHILLFFFILTSLNSTFSQQSDILDKLAKKDSLVSIKGDNLYSKNAVTNELHNIFFRNVYKSDNYNEELEFKREVKRLTKFESKIIDTIIYIQINALGENIYDTSIHSNKFEEFVSNKLHKNTIRKYIENRFVFLNIKDSFSTYEIMENARIIRSSNIFHDVRISPQKKAADTNHLILYIYIQDEFPYGASVSVSSGNNYDFGLENQNIAGTMHHLSTKFRINTIDSIQTFGYRFQYRIPNIINRSLIDVYGVYQNYSNNKIVEIGIVREFSRPGIIWAGGAIFQYGNKNLIEFNGTFVANKYIQNEVWLSKAFPFKSKKKTIHAIVTGLKYAYTNNMERPNVSPTSNFKFWNSNFLLYSLGYSNIHYIQDRLVNGFGRTEDIPIGVSINGLFGRDDTEFGIRNYYGAQVLSRYYTKRGDYINLNAKLGFYSQNNAQSQGVVDFNFQLASKAMNFGNFRLRNYLNLRLTQGLNRDSTDYITLTEYNGIRGADNELLRGNNRYTASFQSNLFLPFSFAGFRFSIFGLVELAKINYDFVSFSETPIRAGATMGISFKNENLIFDLLQIQYGFFPSTSDLTQKGFLVSSIIPFRFQNLDISKPNVVVYE